jgi:hypothetical protein
VILLAEQIAVQRIQRDKLLGKLARFNEALSRGVSATPSPSQKQVPHLSHKHVLANQLQVGHDHGHGSEQRLDVLGQLRAAGIACDTRADTRLDKHVHRQERLYAPGFMVMKIPTELIS